LFALADAAHVGAACLAVAFDVRFLTTTQDSRVRGESHDEVPMEPTMNRRLTTAMTKAVSRMHGTLDGDDSDDEPIWSLELASSWARLDAACGFHALAESEPLITTNEMKLKFEMKLFTTIPKLTGCCLWAPRAKPMWTHKLGLDREPLIPTSPLAVTIPSKTYT
jgi:hypothetical protein